MEKENSSSYFAFEEICVRIFSAQPGRPLTDELPDPTVAAQRFADLLKLKGNKRAIAIALLIKMWKWGVLDERCRFTSLHPLTRKRWAKLEIGVIIETFCKKMGKTQVDWKAFRLMNMGKDEEDWNKEDDMAVKRISANVRKYRDPGRRTKTYELLDPVAYEETIELCRRIDGFDTRQVFLATHRIQSMNAEYGTTEAFPRPA